MACVGDYLVIFGGARSLYGDDLLDELWRFCTITLTWTLLDADAGVLGTGPSARRFLAMTTAGNIVVVFGGYAALGQ